MNIQPPLLYNFRRCPYAMRARMAISYAQVSVAVRDILLKDKPQSMLDASAKGTVPVLVIAADNVLDESRDIMHWALAQNDPQQWYYGLEQNQQSEIDQIIDCFDNEFKPLLDKYKYAVRFPDSTETEYRDQAIPYLEQLEQRLTKHCYLIGDNLTLADIAVFPFIRQFAFVNKQWFDDSDYSNLQNWLQQLIESQLFKFIMQIN